MSRWPLILKLLVLAVPLALTIWAFSTGWMILAIPAMAVFAWLFNTLFLRDI
ncbi:hypothetical protein [uncultured Paracoccus sp.]|uniref:hypothetical protein n=1 Tax=uncultured Paracoccus sp. TaxID=189685 RepID=UPI0026263B98|nr:hypothetical protein [uncultured Paracoccus sp.]